MSNNHYQQQVMALQKPRRKRGVILTPQGWKKLQEAIRNCEIQENCGSRYTFEALSEKTGLAPRTVAKVLERVWGVDKRTLDCFFSAFNLELSVSDYSKPGANFELPENTKVNHYKQRFYPTHIDIPIEIYFQIVEMLNQTLATIMNLKNLVRQAQWNQEMNFYQPDALFDEIVIVLEKYIDLFAAGRKALDGVAMETNCTAAKLSALPEYPFNLLSQDCATELAERLEPYLTYSRH